jgi:hypothetical protein
MSLCLPPNVSLSLSVCLSAGQHTRQTLTNAKRFRMQAHLPCKGDFPYAGPAPALQPPLDSLTGQFVPATTTQSSLKLYSPVLILCFSCEEKLPSRWRRAHEAIQTQLPHAPRVPLVERAVPRVDELAQITTETYPGTTCAQLGAITHQKNRRLAPRTCSTTFLNSWRHACSSSLRFSIARRTCF